MLTAIDRPPVVGPSVLDASMFPDATAAEIAAAVPQGLLVQALSELTPTMLSVDGRIDALAAVERHIAMLQARSTELLSALDAGDTTEDQFTRDAVAAALRVPPASMKTRMNSARDLAERLPSTLELPRAGEISQRHAADLVDLTQSLPPESATAVERSVLGRAPRQITAQFRASVRKAVLRVSSPATEEVAHVDAVTQRRVVFIPDADGMAVMWALLSADSAAAIKATLDAMANTTIHLPGGDERTADQRRADALVDLARNALTGSCSHLRSANPTPAGPTPANPTSAGPTPANPTAADAAGPSWTGTTDPTDTAYAPGAYAPGTDAIYSDRATDSSTDPTDAADTGNDFDWATPTCTDLAPAGSADPAASGFRLVRGHGQRPAVHVTIAASTLMGLDDQSCELKGYGPITAAMGRRIAADPTAGWRRLLTDDRGHVLHASTNTYRPTATIIATVLARDQHCTLPGCRRPAIYDDLDHVIAWRDGDHTTAANMASLCRRHHRLKHAGIWRVKRDDASGVITWTDRTGRSYTSRPPDLPTTTTGTPLVEPTSRHQVNPPLSNDPVAEPDPPPF